GPMVAYLVRAARLRASRSRFSRAASSMHTSAGESLLLVACASRARSASAEARKPRARSASTGSFIVVVVIVSSEVMGDHVAVDDVRGELDGEHAAGACALLLAEDGEGAVVVAALVEQLLDRCGEYGGAVEVEQLARAPDEGADVAAVLEPEAQQLVDAGDLGAEPIAALAVACAGLVGEDGGAVLGQLDGEILSPRAGVLADDAVAVEQAHLGVGGDEREDATRGVVADRVAVAVEADEGGLVRGGARHEVGRDGGAGERKQPLFLLGEDLRDGLFPLRRVLPRHRDGFQEVPERGVAALQRGDHARREEARLEEADGPLDAALVSRRADASGPKRNVKARGELDELVLEADGAAHARRDDALGVVEEPLARDAAEVLRCAHQRAVQAHRRLLEDELGPHRPRVAQQQHEAVERAHAALDADAPDVGPVDLRLLARQRLEAQVHLAGRRRAMVEHEAPERPDAAGVA